MAKFAIECPKCSTVNTASTFIFAKKNIKCGTCQEEFSVKGSRLISKECPKCQKVFIYDQAKSKERKCPSCGDRINAAASSTIGYKMIDLGCPECGCTIEVDKTLEFKECPLCNFKIDIKKEIVKQNLVSDTGVSVIKYEGDNSTFVWKHPIEDFNAGSQLIVHESQEAIFFLNGQMLDSFPAGRYTLETENLPILKGVNKYPIDNAKTPFHAEVYFVNMTVQMGLRWGTDSRVRFLEPVSGIPLDIGASGELNLQVSDPRKLLLKLVGTDPNALRDTDILSASRNTVEAKKHLKSFFKAPLMNAVKSHLGAAIKEQNINILEIDSHLEELQHRLHKRVLPYFEEYGLTIPQFFIMNISLPDSDPNFIQIKNLISSAYLGVKKKEVEANIISAEVGVVSAKTSVASAQRELELVKAQTDAQIKVVAAQGEAEKLKAEGFAEAEVMAAKGYNQKDVLQADVQKSYAEGIGNMGSGGSSGGGSIASDLIGVVAGLKAADAMGGQLGNMFNGLNPKEVNAPFSQSTELFAQKNEKNSEWDCTCGHKRNRGKFCEDCGSPRPSAWDCKCGHKGNNRKFCAECGAKKPSAWDCSCGQKGNRGKFCEDCGKPMEVK